MDRRRVSGPGSLATGPAADVQRVTGFDVTDGTPSFGTPENPVTIDHLLSTLMALSITSDGGRRATLLNQFANRLRLFRQGLSQAEAVERLSSDYAGAGLHLLAGAAVMRDRSGSALEVLRNEGVDLHRPDGYGLRPVDYLRFHEVQGLRTGALRRALHRAGVPLPPVEPAQMLPGPLAHSNDSRTRLEPQVPVDAVVGLGGPARGRVELSRGPEGLFVRMPAPALPARLALGAIAGFPGSGTSAPTPMTR